MLVCIFKFLFKSESIQYLIYVPKERSRKVGRTDSSSNSNHQTVYVLRVWFPGSILCPRSISLFLLRVVHWWGSTKRRRLELYVAKLFALYLLHVFFQATHATCYCTLRTSWRYPRRSTFKPSNSPLQTSSLISPTTALRYEKHYQQQSAVRIKRDRHVTCHTCETTV